MSVETTKHATHVQHNHTALQDIDEGNTEIKAANWSYIACSNIQQFIDEYIASNYDPDDTSNSSYYDYDDVNEEYVFNEDNYNSVVADWLDDYNFDFLTVNTGGTPWEGPGNTPAGPAFAGGDGTEGNPYQIKTTTHLLNLANLISGTASPDNFEDIDGDISGKHFIQISDITWSGSSLSIGTESNPFTGFYNGDGNTISKVGISGGDATAVFAYTEDAEICNLTISGSSGINGTIAGGIVGIDKGGSYIHECIADIPLSGSECKGGVVGKCLNTSNPTIIYNSINKYYGEDIVTYALANGEEGSYTYPISVGKWYDFVPEGLAGEGTSVHPFIANELEDLDQKDYNTDGFFGNDFSFFTYQLQDDVVDYADRILDENGTYWKNIATNNDMQEKATGSYVSEFSSILDGNNHVLSGMIKARLFGNVGNVIIKNLGIVNSLCLNTSFASGTNEYGRPNDSDKFQLENTTTPSSTQKMVNCHFDGGVSVSNAWTKNAKYSYSYDAENNTYIYYGGTPTEVGNGWIKDQYALDGHFIRESHAITLKDQNNNDCKTDGCTTRPGKNVFLTTNRSAIKNKSNVKYNNTVENMYIADIVGYSMMGSDHVTDAAIEATDFNFALDGTTVLYATYLRESRDGVDCESLVLPFTYSLNSDVKFYNIEKKYVSNTEKRDFIPFTLDGRLTKDVTIEKDNYDNKYDGDDKTLEANSLVFNCLRNNKEANEEIEIQKGTPIIYFLLYYDGQFPRASLFIKKSGPDFITPINLNGNNNFVGALQTQKNLLSRNYDSYKFSGTVEQVKIKDTGLTYIDNEGNTLSNNNEEHTITRGLLLKCTTNSWIYPFRSYIRLPKDQNPANVRMVFLPWEDDDVMAIDSVQMDNKVFADGPIYSVTGALIEVSGDRSALAPGLYIQGGKKFMVR